MKDSKTLSNILKKIDKKGYKAYEDIEGSYEFRDCILFIDHVQGDPFASPSRVRIVIDIKNTEFPESLYNSKERRIALSDYISRKFAGNIKKYSKGNRGAGKSGMIYIDHGKQKVIERTSVIINDESIEIRFFVGLPAYGRRIIAKEAYEIFFTEIPQIVGASIRELNHKEIKRHVELFEDQEFLRNYIKNINIVAFIANDSILPRRSGVDDRVLINAIPFKSPRKLEIEINLPNEGLIRGMGIPEGITLIVGGGFHGKSTLLKAIEMGVYNHISGDGREYVVTIEEALKIRAEDGRRIEKVNISPFIKNLPFSKDTIRFSTDNASGSTSQAANIIEALEMGVKLLLIDEDTSATNFMIRDYRMQELVNKDKEPITPFVDKVGQLRDEYGISTILVMGGSGDYFDVADRVIMMDNYQPKDVTERVKEIKDLYKTNRRLEGGDRFGSIFGRVPLKDSFDASRGRRDVKIDAKGLQGILFGNTFIDLSALEQLVDLSQTKAIGEIIYYYSEKYCNKNMTLKESLGKIIDDIKNKGLDILTPYKRGDIAMPRIFEVGAAINRMRSLRII